MRKILALTMLLVALSAVSCASMSLEDYAEECGEWRDDYGWIDPDSSSVSDLEDALEDWNALSPPGDVKAIHDLAAESLRLGLETAEEREELQDQLDDLQDELEDARRSQRDDIRDEMDDLSDEWEDLRDDLRDRLDDLGDDYEDELDDLPRRVERELEREDCI